MRVDCGLEQRIIDYPNVGAYISNVEGCPIPWATDNLVCMDLLQPTINSSNHIIIFDDEDHKME